MKRVKSFVQLTRAEAADRWVVADEHGATSWIQYRLPPIIKTQVGEMHFHSPVERDTDGMWPEGREAERCDVLEGPCYPEASSATFALDLAAIIGAGDVPDDRLFTMLEGIHRAFFVEGVKP